MYTLNAQDVSFEGFDDKRNSEVGVVRQFYAQRKKNSFENNKSDQTQNLRGHLRLPVRHR